MLRIAAIVLLLIWGLALFTKHTMGGFALTSCLCLRWCWASAGARSNVLTGS